jgi:hypothetical protein
VKTRSAATLDLTTVLTTTVTTVAAPATPPTRPFAPDLACSRRLPAPGSVKVAISLAASAISEVIHHELRRIDYRVVPQCVSSFRSHHSWHFLNEAGTRRVDQTGQAARRRYTSRTFHGRRTSNHRAVSAPNAFRAATESRRAAQLTFHEVHPPHSRLQFDELAREKAPALPDRRRLWSAVGRTGPCR